MQPFQERLARTKSVLDNPDLTITPGEALKFLYNYYRFEYALLQRQKATRKCKKYADLLNQDIDTFNLRMEMKDL